jgi:hypothetical protein
MKKTFTAMFLLFSFLLLSCGIVDCAETQSSKKKQQTLSKPILPPVVPNPLPSVSPTPSPNISVPPIMLDTMDAQNIYSNTKLHRPVDSIPTLPNLPKLPTLPLSTNITKAAPSVPILPQKIPLIKNLLGTVVNKGSEKDEILWLDGRDRFSEETIRINVDSKRTRVIKKDVSSLALKDIKVGDAVRIVFNQAGKNMPVNVIDIITEQDLKINTQPE